MMYKVPMGLTVRVVNCSKYAGQLNSCLASVVNGEYSEVRLKVEGRRNGASAGGDYYVPRHCIEVQMPDGKFINLKQYLMTADDQVKNITERKIKMIGKYSVLTCKYVDTPQQAQHIINKVRNDAEVDRKGTYEFACFDHKISVGDTVLVMSASHGLSVAVVIDGRIKVPEDDANIIREVICDVEIGTYLLRVDARKRAAELKEQMTQRAKALQDVALFETLAKNDPDMAAMLSQYKQLNG